MDSRFPTEKRRTVGRRNRWTKRKGLPRIVIRRPPLTNVSSRVKACTVALCPELSPQLWLRNETSARIVLRIRSIEKFARYATIRRSSKSCDSSSPSRTEQIFPDVLTSLDEDDGCILWDVEKTILKRSSSVFLENLVARCCDVNPRSNIWTFVLTL